MQLRGHKEGRGWANSPSFNVRSLFSAGEQGAWYDPSDLSTMFQNSAGTTPVTAVEQSVGLILDKSKRLVVGSELVTNGDFNNGTTGWGVVSTGVLSVVSGSLKIENNSSSSPTAYTSITTKIGSWYKFAFSITDRTANVSVRSGNAAGYSENYISAEISSPTTREVYFVASATTTFLSFVSRGNTIGQYVSIDNISVKEIAGNHAYQSTDAKRPVLSARVNLLLSTETLATQSVITLATNYTLSFSGTGTVTLSGTKTGTYSSGVNTLSGVTAGTLTLTVSGTVSKADLRVSNDGVGIPAYQRVNTATDYDTVGFPKYLKFDGVDDALSTSSIDFTGTDKVNIFLGLRKLSDASSAIVLELSVTSSTNPRTFGMFAPSGTLNDFFIRSRGTANCDNTVTTYLAPITKVFTAIEEIPNDINTIRLNGVNIATATADQGTGTYGNFPLYIGARAGTSIYFNGRLYGLIVRGATSTATQITKAEKYINGKTKAY